MNKKTILFLVVSFILMIRGVNAWYWTRVDVTSESMGLRYIGGDENPYPHSYPVYKVIVQHFFDDIFLEAKEFKVTRDSTHNPFFCWAEPLAWYDTNAEAPPGIYFATLGADVTDPEISYPHWVYLGDTWGSARLQGPDGERTGIAFHVAGSKGSQGCLLFSSVTEFDVFKNYLNGYGSLSFGSVYVYIENRHYHIDGQWYCLGEYRFTYYCASSGFCESSIRGSGCGGPWYMRCLLR